MTPDFSGSELELQLKASLAQQEAQAHRTRELLAQLEQSTAGSTKPGYPHPPSDATFQFTATPSTPAQHGGGRPLPPHGGSMAPHLGQPALYQHSSYTPMKRVKTCQPGLQQSMPGPATSMVRSKSSFATPNPFTGGPGSVRPVPSRQQGQMPLDGFPIQTEQQRPAHANTAHSMDGFMGIQHHGPDLFPVMENGSSMMGMGMGMGMTMGMGTGMGMGMGMGMGTGTGTGTGMATGMGTGMGTGTMENPGDFLQRLEGVSIPRNHRTIPVYGQHPPPMDTTYQTFQPQDLSPSQCGSLTSGPSISDMSRSNSNANQSASAAQMISYDSQSSFADGTSNPEFGYSPDQQLSPSKKRSAPGEDLLGIPTSSSSPCPFVSYPPVHMGRSPSIDSRLSSGHSQQAPRVNRNRLMSIQSSSMQRSESKGVQHGESMMRAVSGSSDQSTPSQRELSQAVRHAAARHGESMVRTISASSAKSTQSQRQQRHNEALKSHIAHAEMQPLAPKPKADSIPTSSQSDVKNGTDGKVAMPRTSGYQRPKRPKISCDQCDENPDGFRGEHELRRHKDLKHSKEFKRFVCRTPSQLGAESDLQPIYPLDKCKHCISNKEYGQYYNAAAHLRRAHFTKKPPRASRSKNALASGSDEPKRGGKGGGDWPPMSELKAKWMEEIKSTKPAHDAATVSDDDNQQDMDVFEGTAYSYVTVPAGFDDTAASFVGSAANLQVQNTNVYTDTFNADLNYTTSPALHEFDTSMLSSTGSANFDFNASSAAHGGFHAPELAIDLNLATAFQSPHNSTSTATLTPFHAFGHEGHFSHKGSGPMMAAQQDMLEEMDFGLAMGAEYDDATPHLS